MAAKQEFPNSLEVVPEEIQDTNETVAADGMLAALSGGQEPEAEASTTKGEPAEDKGEKKTWDKDRQKKDQANAAERKALKSENTELRTQLNEVSARVDDMSSVSETAIPELSKDADFDEVVAVVKLQQAKIGELLAQKSTPPAEMKALQETVSKLQDDIATQRSREDVNATIARLNAKYGASFHNEAVTLAVSEVERAGFTGRIPQNAIDHYLESAYFKVSAEAGKTRKKAIPQDPGVGGGEPADKQKTGTLDDVMADLMSG